MNNDLISRKALRNEIDTWGCNDYDKYDFLEAIDDAPTVEMPNWYKVYEDVKSTFERPQCNQIAWEQGYEAGVAQGKSERPTGDLTEAEKKICKMYLEDLDKTHTCNEYTLLMNLIDDAPTVNPYFPLSEEVFNYITDAEFEHSDSFYIVTPSGKKIEFEKKRAHGKWIIVKDKRRGDYVKCPFCGKEIAGTDLNFCVKCGGDMREVANESPSESGRELGKGFEKNLRIDIKI